MYHLIRFLFVAIPTVLLGVLLAKKTKLSRNKRVSLSIVCLLLLIGVTAVPIENAFFSFSSAEQLEQYVNTFQGKPDAVIEGDTSALILRFDQEKTDLRHYRRTEKGFKIGRSSSISFFRGVCGDDFSASLFKCGNDYYVVVTSLEDIELAVTDNVGTAFQKKTHTYRIVLEQITRYNYVAYVPDFDEEYRLTVNGEEYQFEIDSQISFPFFNQ